jgi:23S rRNA pseudouridine1911/1915/1917 synthase
MSRKFEFVVSSSGTRLDVYIVERYPHISRSRIQRLIKDGYITVNGRPAKEGLKLRDGDRVQASIPTSDSSQPEPEDIPLHIVYEDSDLLVVDKPAGITVHPAPGHSRHTLVNAVLAHCPDIAIEGSTRPGIVHRLDKNTSGLMVVAKHEAARQHLMDQFKSRIVLKRYIALVEGHLSPEEGMIEAPIGREPRSRRRMSIVEDGREARTAYRVLKYVNGCTLLELTLQTGRTHQIRVHLSAIGYPVVGDDVYGRKSPASALLSRQFLHACHIGFKLPSSGRWVEFHSDLPQDLEQALERISL